MTVGVISDTHGLLRPEAVEALRGSDLIVHAGDVGAPEILERLRALAPTTAVRGNVDTQPWARQLPLTEVVPAGKLHLYVLHDLSALDLDPKAAGFGAVISGHSHKPVAQTRDGVLYLNPGSAGPRRFSLPICLARLHVEDTRLRHEFIHLAVLGSGRGLLFAAGRSKSHCARRNLMLQNAPMYSYIPAKDVARARKFYEGTLGFKPGQEIAGGVRYDFGGHTSCFLYPTPNAGTSRASQAFWKVEDIEREVAELRSKGVTFEEYDMPGMKTRNGIFTGGGSKAAWFKDTEGNIMALVQDDPSSR